MTDEMKETQNKHAVEPEESGARKVLDTIMNIVTGIVMLAAFAMMIFTIVSVSTFDRNDRDIFGYKAFIVRSDSMKASGIDAGDLILLKEVDPEGLKAGDIIAFRSMDPNSFGETFTHMIRSLTTMEDGEPGFVTYGTTTGVDDLYPVGYGQILGQYQFALNGVGTFFTFLKTVPGYICCIFIPFMLLIISQGLNSVKLFRQYKEEQMAELEEKRQKEMGEMMAERERLEAEREASRKMLEELQRLQAQMGGSDVRNETDADKS